jgi:hypothetical protein
VFDHCYEIPNFSQICFCLLKHIVVSSRILVSKFDAVFAWLLLNVIEVHTVVT